MGDLLGLDGADVHPRITCGRTVGESGSLAELFGGPRLA
jgi:hypothetical protein